MKELATIDYMYTVVGILVGLVMILSPRSFVRKAKFDEQSIKTELVFKRFGIALIIISLIFGIFIFRATHA